MIKQDYMPYMNAVMRMSQDSQLKTRIIAAAVAIATASVLSIPSTPVDSPESHYSSTCALLVRGEVGEYNEVAVLDCPVALDLSKKFWLTRYNSVHQAAPMPPSKGAFFLGYSGASRFFSPDEVAFLNDYAEEIFQLQVAINQVKKSKDLTNVVA